MCFTCGLEFFTLGNYFIGLFLGEFAVGDSLSKLFFISLLMLGLTRGVFFIKDRLNVIFVEIELGC
jgi:hypothetical protein